MTSECRLDTSKYREGTISRHAAMVSVQQTNVTTPTKVLCCMLAVSWVGAAILLYTGNNAQVTGRLIGRRGKQCSNSSPCRRQSIITIGPYPSARSGWVANEWPSCQITTFTWCFYAIQTCTLAHNRFCRIISNTHVNVQGLASMCRCVSICVITSFSDSFCN
jgi:hypothetical protein